LRGLHTISWTASDPDGDKLTYSIWYSRDAGQTWMPLDINLTDSSLAVNFDSLPGSDSGQLRVLASDGVNTSEARLPIGIHVPLKAPKITVSGAKDGASFSSNEDFVIQCSAFDLQDGMITDPNAFSWTDDKDGSLGTGLWLVPHLSPGKHLLTVVVTDTQGATASASLHLIIENPAKPAATAAKTVSELKPVADLSTLGQKWTVTEGDFHGTWIIHADSKVIEAFWEGPDHQQISDKLTLESFDGSTIVVYRESLKGRYQGKLSADGRHFIGTASWYPAGMTWSADIHY